MYCKISQIRSLFLIISLIQIPFAFGQEVMNLKGAIEISQESFGRLNAKQLYAKAAEQNVAFSKRQYLPNLNISAQHNYGTINGQNGPLYGFSGLGTASSGLPLDEQNWNAGFGALYLANFNWDFFTFGRVKNEIRVAESNQNIADKDYSQEQFQHKIRVSSAYLNLLASEFLMNSQQKNVDRAEVFHKKVSQLVKNGLMAGVDSTLTFAEVSRAKIQLNQAKEQVRTQNNQLVQLMGLTPRKLMLDSTFIFRKPSALELVNTENEHPIRSYMLSKINQSISQEKVFRSEQLPTLSFWSIYQIRGSGFNADYATDQTSYTTNYLDGIEPTMQNYLIGIGIRWNLTSIARFNKKYLEQKFITQALQEEYKAVDLEIKANNDAADYRMEYANENYDEAPIQVDAALKAYNQRVALYENGLTDLTDVTTALYTLNRAETDRDIAFSNLWQAWLLKAAALGNFELFSNEL